MATLVPPPSKRQKREAQQAREVDLVPEDLPNVTIQFQAADTGESVGGNIRVPGGTSEKQLEDLLNQLLGHDEDDPVPYTFSLVKSQSATETSLIDIKDNIYSSVLKPGHKTSEDEFKLVYTPRAVFRVKPVTRSSSEMSGHGTIILAAQFAPHTSSRMVTGSGDATARIWDCYTQTSFKTLAGHKDAVLAVSWSPDGRYIATGSQDRTIRIWDPKTGEQIGRPLTGHGDLVASLCWEPYHLVEVGQAPRLASCSKDGTVRVWDVLRQVCVFSMGGHTGFVKCVKWGGLGDIYSAAHDKTIKVWSSKDGRLITTLKGHAHWVNHLALSTEHALRVGPFDNKGGQPVSDEQQAEMKAKAQLNFEKLARVGGKVVERLVSASDDLTMYVWEPSKSSKPVKRLTGHQKVVNHVAFSPDGRFFASASFDNSVKLWDGRDGNFLGTFRGHVADAYQVAWSSDCRYLVSASKDTTLKVWDVKTRKLHTDLPGHKDAVYAVDWSVDGERVVSGGRDKKVRIWTH